MKKKPLGCFSVSAITAFIITIIIAGIFAVTSGSAMFSPGELSNYGDEILGGVASHKQIGHDCAACHVAPLGAGKMSDRCLTCHNEVKAEVTSDTSLHGALLLHNPLLACRDCHPEHRGADAPLVEMNSATFPHEAVGFALTSHSEDGATFSCEGCHTQGITSFDQLICIDCHQSVNSIFMQPHQLAYGDNCLACHDGVETYGSEFKHDKATSFPLTGKHSGESCSTCHWNAHSITDFRNAPEDCAGCHTKDDAHQQRFGSNCGTCHTTAGWEPANFDHELITSDCATCHQADDAHNGKYGADCAVCHSNASWKPATFDHGISNFPLTGAHISLDCETCHSHDSFSGLSGECVTCHADPEYHLGAFGTDCATCHTTSAWTPAEYNKKHTFPLNHGENGVSSCVTCHLSDFNSYTCYECHEHDEAQIRSKHQEEGIANFQDCMECHADGREHDD